MKRSLKEWALRVAVLLAGLCVAHFGVTLFLLSDLGSDPFNVLIQGLYRTLSRLSGAPWLSHGRVHIAVSLLILAALFFVDRSYIKIGTALCMALGGPIIDFFSVLLAPLASSPLAVRICLLVAGCVILAFGMTMVIRSDAGTGPNDLVALVVSEKRKWRFSIVRVAVDALFVLCGFLLGGTAGAGTLVCMFLVGPVAGFFLPLNGRWIEALVGRLCS
ncbi:MAG: YitT family protein [Oscillospiraceae bacterium]|nr:YitT family protein [Oscillospiraceae bacterium]